MTEFWLNLRVMKNEPPSKSSTVRKSHGLSVIYHLCKNCRRPISPSSTTKVQQYNRGKTPGKKTKGIIVVQHRFQFILG